MKLSKTIVAVAALLALGHSDVWARALTIADAGRTTYVIAVAADAIPAETTAASELAQYLGQVTGATFVVHGENEVPADAPQILVGAGPRVKHLLPQQDWTALGSDGIVIKTEGRDLILAGGRPRGALYAVYSFLEDQVGVRWWTPTASTVPRRAHLQIPAQTVVYTPQLFYREYYTTDLTADPVYAARMKENGHSQTEDEAHGGHYTILGFVHTFAKLLPPEKYFKQHPEWYSDPTNGGKPCTAASPMPAPQTWQLCLTNEEARRELTRNALEWIAKNPGAGMIALDQNDNHCVCTDPADVAIQEREGSPSGPLLEFVNAVAADIEKQYPGFLVETLAYQYTRKPPRFVRPRHNVIVRLCSIEADFSKPLDSRSNADFAADLAGWKAIAPRLFVWDYVTNFHNCIGPYPNLPVLGPNLKYFADNNVGGVFEEGDDFTNDTGDFVQMRAWVTAHLMWNPHQDESALIDEFLSGYYGAAAPHLRAYLDTIIAAFAGTGQKLSTFEGDNSWLTLAVVDTAATQFRQAEKAVAADTELSARVRQARLSLDDVWISRYMIYKRAARLGGATFEGPVDIAAFTTDFVAAMRAHHVLRRSESELFEPYAEGLLTRSGAMSALGKAAAPLPEKLAVLARGKTDEELFDVQEGEFQLYQPGTVTSIVNDSKATDGKAVRMIGNTMEWATQYRLEQFPEEPDGSPWHCYILARVEPKETATGSETGQAMAMGIYDVGNKKSLCSLNVSLHDSGDNQYHVYDLGPVHLGPNMYVWVAPQNNSGVTAVYVDRMVFIRDRSPQP